MLVSQSLCDLYPVPVLLACIPIFIVLSKVFRAVTDPRREIPGPFVARFSRIWWFYAYWTQKGHLRMQELHKKYGPVVRIAPGKYSFNDPEANKTIYAPGSKFIKSDWYKVFSHPKFEGIFNVRDPVKHSVIRRKVASVYTMSSIISYEPYARECQRLYIQHLDNFTKTGESFDLMHWNQCYAFDMSGMLTFSHRLGFLDRGGDEMGLITALARSGRWNMLIGIYHFVYPWMSLLLALLYGGRRSVLMVADYADEQFLHAKKAVAAEASSKDTFRAEDETGPTDFITKLVRMEEDKTSRKGVTQLDVKMAATQNLAAGSDTTGISLTAIIYFATKHPQVLAQLRKETEEAMAALPDERADEFIPFSIGQKMPYLRAVIKEVLRVHPAAGVSLPRVVPPEGAVIGDKFFPGGSDVMVNAWVTHGNTDIWGPDAKEFKPERWLEEGHTPPDSQFFSFGQGSRSCIGRHVASLEMTTLVPALLTRYEFEVLPGKHDAAIDTYTNVFAKPKDVRVTVKRRGVKA